jgi:hypothetical protein
VTGWQPQQGATLLMPSGPGGDHLFVVLNDPKVFPNYGSHPQVLLVNLSTVRTGVHFDATCVLQQGCHPFVKVVSYVVYRSARVEAQAHLLTLIEKGVFRPQDPMPAAVFGTIRSGLFASPFTKREFKSLPI